MTKIVNDLSLLGAAVRQEGMGALLQGKERIKNPLFRDGISLILNSFTPQEIKHNLIANLISIMCSSRLYPIRYDTSRYNM
jgi:flagellar motor component MotA